MTIDDFRSRLCRDLDVFISKYKNMHELNPVQYPLELDSFLEWEENFMIFSVLARTTSTTRRGPT